MRRLREQKDRVSLERQRQLELMKLKHDEKKARREEKFNSAALVIGRAKDEQKRYEVLNILICFTTGEETKTTNMLKDFGQDS